MKKLLSEGVNIWHTSKWAKNMAECLKKNNNRSKHDQGINYATPMGLKTEVHITLNRLIVICLWTDVPYDWGKTRTMENTTSIATRQSKPVYITQYIRRDGACLRYGTMLGVLSICFICAIWAWASPVWAWTHITAMCVAAGVYRSRALSPVTRFSKVYSRATNL